MSDFDFERIILVDNIDAESGAVKRHDATKRLTETLKEYETVEVETDFELGDLHYVILKGWRATPVGYVLTPLGEEELKKDDETRKAPPTEDPDGYGSGVGGPAWINHLLDYLESEHAKRVYKANKKQYGDYIYGGENDQD